MMVNKKLDPHPSKRKELIEFYSGLYENLGQYRWIGKKLKFPNLPEGKEPLHLEKDYKYSLHLFERAEQQANEACNKLWTTLELYDHLGSSKDHWLCGYFKSDFAQTATIPVLYYSLISAMISILHFYGIGSVRRKGKSFNLIRTEDSFLLQERSKYIHEKFGQAERGWHNKVFQMYEGFLKMGIELPEINLERCEELKQYRNEFDYDLLGKTRMSGVVDKGYYFDYCPLVIDTIKKSIELLHNIENPLRNNADKRFNKLTDKVNRVFSKHNID